VSTVSLGTPAEFSKFVDHVHAGINRAGDDGTVDEQVAALLDAEGISATRDQIRRISRDIENVRSGFGVLAPLMADPSITDIAVDSWSVIRVLRVSSPGWERVHAVAFPSRADLENTMAVMLGTAGASISVSVPVVDASLPGGIRLCAMVPPVTDGPAMTIRKPRYLQLSLEDMSAGSRPSMSGVIAAFLSVAVWGRLNILVSGGTGSGKTTLMATLLGLVPESERIVLIEDVPELADRLSTVQTSHVVPLHADRDNPAATPDELLRTSLRLKPDRIIVGEVRGGEALTYLDSLNTGHEGSICSIHANSPADAVRRLARLCLKDPTHPTTDEVRGSIGAALHMVVQVALDGRDGRRYVSEISEVVWDGASAVSTVPAFRHEGGKWISKERPSFWPLISELWPKGRRDPWGGAA
jgi:pilus assembly protein CpaF